MVRNSLELQLLYRLYRFGALRMANDAININIPLKFDVRSPPPGMTDYDPKALSADQQRELNTYKLKLRRENVIYLKEHPEVKALVSMVTRMTIIHHPRNVIDFVSKIFTRPERQIREEINKILSECTLECEPISYSDYEEWDS